MLLRVSELQVPILSFPLILPVFPLSCWQGQVCNQSLVSASKPHPSTALAAAFGQVSALVQTQAQCWQSSLVRRNVPAACMHPFRSRRQSGSS